MSRQYFINNEEVFVDPRWSIADKINARSTANFKVVDIGNLTDIYNGDSFVIQNSEGVIFKGVVKLVKKFESSPGFLQHNIKVADNSAKADKLLIADSWSNILSGDLMKDVIAQRLYLDGVVEGIIQDGPLLNKVVSPYYKCSKLFDEVKNLTGYIWNIDNLDQLNYFERGTFVAPWTLNNSVQHKDFNQERKMDQYANSVFTRGGLGETDVQTQEKPSPAPDGESRTFTHRFPMAEKPIIELNINGTGWVAVDPADIGVNGIDEDGTKKWYFSYNSNTLTQDSSESILLPPSASPVYAGDQIRVTYTGLKRIFVKSDDPIEIADRAAIETGTSGIYEKIIHNDNIVTAEQAIDYTQGQLRIFAQVDEVVTFWTNVKGLQAGMLLPIDKPLYGIKGNYLIESITMKPDGPNNIRYSVKALSGSVVGGWEKFFANIVDQGAEFVIGANETIIIISVQSEKTAHEGTYEMTIYEPPKCGDTLICGTFVVGGPVVSEVTIND